MAVEWSNSKLTEPRTVSREVNTFPTSSRWIFRRIPIAAELESGSGCFWSVWGLIEASFGGGIVSSVILGAGAVVVAAVSTVRL